MGRDRYHSSVCLIELARSQHKMENTSIPHVLLFPYPAQGNIDPMLKLAELLCLSGLNVTFLNTEYNHYRLLRSTDAQSRFGRFPGFRFETIIDGLPQGHPFPALSFFNPSAMLPDQLHSVIKSAFREMIVSDRLKYDVRGQVNCIIADGVMGFTVDVAEEVGIPCIFFRTGSACCSWIFFCLPKLVDNGDLPVKDDEDMNRLLKCVPEMESFLQFKDLPSYCRVKELSDPGLQFVWTEAFNSTRAAAQILNTFEDLESPVLNQLRSNYWPNLYTIGPLHSLLKSRRKQSSNGQSLEDEDRGNWKAWLDLQPKKSVVLVIFGGLAVVSWEQVLELWYGLVNSGKKFLWIRRRNPNAGRKEEEEEGTIPSELSEGTRERGYIVGWAPQKEVLVHPSIGGFLTYSGWNSTLESVEAGVPLICWPQLGDQHINGRYVSEVWKNGVNLGDYKFDRSTVEKLVRDVVDEGKREELMRSTNKIAQMAKKSISVDGSSYCNFEALVEFIRKTSL